MLPPLIHSYLLWRGSLEPEARRLVRNRLTACAALLPALMVGLFVFGWYAGLVTLAALAGAFLADLLAQRLFYRNQPGPSDALWLTTGLFIALLLPPNLPLLIPLLGGAGAMILGKYVLAVDSVPFLQPAALGLLLLHLCCFPWLHPKRPVEGVTTTTTVWRPQTAYQAGEWVRNTGEWNGSIYQCAAVGEQPHQSGAVEPVWPTVVGATIADGSLTWVSRRTAERWAPGAPKRPGDFVQPTVPNGRVYECVFRGPGPGPGQTGRVEPAWLQEDGATVRDGELLWRCHAAPHAPAWPVLTRLIGLQFEKGKKEESLTAPLLEGFLGGDITRAIGRRQYQEELLANRQPEFRPGVRAEAVYGPRPLDVVQAHSGYAASSLREGFEPVDLMLGYTPGGIGATSALALGLGALLLILTGTVSWVAPFTALLAFTFALHLSGSPNVWLHLLSGYTLMNFFYLSADPTTTARSLPGKALAGLAAGLIEFLLRTVAFSEASFLTPLLVQGLSIFFDQYVTPPKESRPALAPGSLPSLGRL